MTKHKDKMDLSKIFFLPGWRNGIREGLKILCSQELVGSSPTPGTNKQSVLC